MTTFIPAAILLMTLTNATQASSAVPAGQQWAAESMPSSQQKEISSLLNAIQRASRPDDPAAQALHAVFVVPGPDLNAETLTAVREDMMVMCRIFDKAMAPLLPKRGSVTVFDPFSGRTAVDSRSQTQGLYLDGYGAVFFIEVGFPLAASLQEPEQRKSEPSADPLWSQTVDELRGTPPSQNEPAVPEYDAEKVDSLKKTLIRSLRHASNLRVPGPQDLINVVITSRRPDGLAYVYSTGRSPASLQTEPPSAEPSDVLVFRTAKPEVDAFAKGDLTMEQFTEKVRILRSWTNSARQAAAKPVLGLRSSGSTSVQRR